MATRRETNRRKLAMSEALRRACGQGALQPGAMLPSVRELAAQHNLSLDVVSHTLQQLTGEGLVYTVPRVGTFVGQAQPMRSAFYLLLHSPEALPPDLLMQLQAGFEERIAQRGGTTLAMPLATALEYRERGELPALEGVFDFAYQPPVRGARSPSWGLKGDLPRVGFAGRIEAPRQTDVVSFDDVEGGRQAAQHLLRLGHRRIAYLGLHPQPPATAQRTGKQIIIRLWSAQREAGWRQAMTHAGCFNEGLAYHPLAEPAHGDYEAEARVVCEAAVPLLQRGDITAVVTANDRTAQGLFEALRAAEVPAARWPAVVGFDNLAAANGHVISSLRLPWEELGHVAADLLWERSHGQLVGPSQQREVPMRLIARLTSYRLPVVGSRLSEIGDRSWVTGYGRLLG